MTNIDELLERIERVIEKGTALPLTSGKAIVNAEEITNIIDEIRLCLPREINEARKITHDRNDIVADARKEAEDIKRIAEERARAMVSKDEITRRATIQANETISIANTKARQIYANAIDFAESRLRACEEVLAEKQKELRQSLAAVRSSRGELNANLNAAADKARKQPAQDKEPKNPKKPEGSEEA